RRARRRRSEWSIAGRARLSLGDASPGPRCAAIPSPDSDAEAILFGRRCTVLLLDDQTASADDLQLHSLAHGVILLEHVALEYGSERRRLQVTKLRGSPFWGGYHDFRIRRGGLVVYPRISIGKPNLAPERLLQS